MGIDVDGFWSRVDTILEEKGETLTDFASGIGQQYRNVIMWRNRCVLPGAKYLPDIASWLGTSVDWLLTGNSVESLTAEQMAVKDDEEINYIVRALLKEPSLKPTLVHLLKRTEKKREGAPLPSQM